MNREINICSIILMMFGYFLTGIQMLNPSCFQVDFNRTESILEFEPCSADNEFTLKSYVDAWFSPFRDDSLNYLSNIQAGRSCFTSTKSFSLDEYSQFQSAIYLHSLIVDDASYVEIQVLDVDSGAVYTAILIDSQARGVWNELYNAFVGPVENAKIIMKAFTTTGASLAIEYLNLNNPRKAESYCQRVRPTETTMETTMETTTIETTIETTTETTTEKSTERTTETVTETTTPEIDTPEIEVPARLDVDFNNLTSLLETFQECHGKYLPELTIKSYLDSTITPYRETSLFCLSNKWEGLSCLETISVFSLVDSNFIESAIFLNGVSPGAWIEISAVDIRTGERELIKRLQTENNWVRLSEEIKGKFSDAQIIITTNMNSYSQLAIEYLHIRGESG